jgi:hypothetical protein
VAVIGKTHTSVSAMRDSSDTRCLSAPTALSLVTMKRLFMDSGGAFGGPPAQSGLAVKCLVAAPHSAAGHVRSTTCCRPDRRNVVSGRKLVSTNTDVPSRIALAQAGAAMGSWHHREPMVFFGKGDLMIHKAVRFCQVGRPFPSRPDRTNKDSLLGSKQVDPWIRGTYHESIGFLRGGSAMTLEPAGSDRQVRCSSPVHPDDRSRLT